MRLRDHLPWLVFVVAAGLLVALVERRATASRTLRFARADLEWIEEQVLVHEAWARRLDRGDPLIRQTILAQVARALTPDLAPLTQAELAAYHAAHPDRYRNPPSLDLSIATFGDEGVPADARVRLASGEAPDAVGPSRDVGAHLRRMSRTELRQLLGTGFADAVFAADAGTWIGPLESTLGQHLVRVDARHAAEALPLDAVESIVRIELAREREGERLEALLKDLRVRYRVEGLDR